MTVLETEMVAIVARLLVGLVAVVIVWRAARKLPKHVRKEKWGLVFRNSVVIGLTGLIAGIAITHETQWRPKAVSTQPRVQLPELSQRELRESDTDFGAKTDPDTLRERNEASAEANKEPWKE